MLTGSAAPGSPLSSGSPPVKSEEDELAALGGMTRLVPRKPSSAPSTPSYAGSSPKSDPASPSPIQSTIPEQSPYHSPDQTTAWQYPLPSREYTEHSQYPHYSPEADASMRYTEPQLQHGISPMNGMTDPYFGGYSSSQYYRPEFDNAFQNGLRNAGDFNLPVETGDSWHNLVASQYKPM